jgi:hypothetical protein
MAKKCRNCRKKKMNAGQLPTPRPPRGSLRKAKRVEMRKQKMANLAAAQATAQAKAQAASQVDVPNEPKGHVLRQAAHNSIHLVSR